MATAHFKITIKAAPERLPSAFDVQNSLSRLSNMGEDEYQIYVTGRRGSYNASIVTYPTMLPTAEDIQRVLAVEDSSGDYTVTVDKIP